MTHAVTSLIDTISRLWGSQFLPNEKRRWSIGGARSSPEIRAVDPSTTIASQALTAFHNYSVRRRWYRELQALNDHQLSDIGISRDDIRRITRRLRFWI